MGSEKNRQGMARFAINAKNAYGVSIPDLRQLGKKVGKDHKLAAELWQTGVHEGRLLAAFIDDEAKVTSAQLERWVKDFDSWDVCDQCCSSLFDKTPFALKKAVQWSRRREEFVKRAGFVLMASLAVHEKRMPDAEFIRFLRRVREESHDERNFVRKAVNWALRQIGKRNKSLNTAAIGIARQISREDSPAARWISSDALRELTGSKVRTILVRKASAGRALSPSI